VRRWRTAGAALWLLCAGCALSPGAKSSRGEQTLFAGSLQELAPHHPGDRFLYRITGAGEHDGVYVEQLSATSEVNEIVAILTRAQDSSPVVTTRLRNSGKAIAIVSEELSGLQDVGFAYAQPIPYLEVPLRTGVRKAASPVTMWRLSDGRGLADGQVEQTMTASRPAGDETSGDLQVHTERDLQFPGMAIYKRETAWFRPGIGEVRSESSTNGGPPVYQELICARIDGKQIGDCGSLNEENAGD
jgi:hypothetical protein